MCIMCVIVEAGSHNCKSDFICRFDLSKCVGMAARDHINFMCSGSHAFRLLIDFVARHQLFISADTLNVKVSFKVLLKVVFNYSREVHTSCISDSCNYTVGSSAKSDYLYCSS